ncbi:hypothetical protein [Flavobacterium sp.]|uniref:hypothetical protein n=1 Tax=Flavobacterium sp. TaxID=239 RepID=UPI0026250660|nr:hypothetical protein [Flavobacterium sp.]
MSLEKSYYSVQHNQMISLDDFIFNNFSLPIRFRREEALTKFFELINLKDNQSTIKLIYHNHHIERDFDSGVIQEFDVFPKRVLFQVVNGKVEIDWTNWINETREYTNEGEVNFGKLVKAKLPNGNIGEVYSDKICRKLNIEYDYFDWED